MRTIPCTISQVLPVHEPVIIHPVTKTVFTLDEILMDICVAFEQPIASVLGKGRKDEVVLCRKLFFYVAKSKTGESLKNLGEYIGGRDHTTSLYHVHDVIDLLKVRDPSFVPKWNKYLEKSQLFTPNDFR
jgi:chromosomal replication initiation ATPase DnaA